MKKLGAGKDDAKALIAGGYFATTVKIEIYELESSYPSFDSYVRIKLLHEATISQARNLYKK